MKFYYIKRSLKFHKLRELPVFLARVYLWVHSSECIQRKVNNSLFLRLLKNARMCALLLSLAWMSKLLAWMSKLCFDNLNYRAWYTQIWANPGQSKTCQNLFQLCKQTFLTKIKYATWKSELWENKHFLWQK